MVALICLALAVAPAAAAEDPAGGMYEPNTVEVIELTLPPESNKDSKRTRRANTSRDVLDGEPRVGSGDGRRLLHPDDVGIRLKGQFGSFRDLAEKAGFKIKFNFVERQKKKFLGLKKMTLNNMVQDTSLIHERPPMQRSAPPGCHRRIPASPSSKSTAKTSASTSTSRPPTTSPWKSASGRSYPQHLYEGAYGSDVAGGVPASKLTRATERRRRPQRPDHGRQPISRPLLRPGA